MNLGSAIRILLSCEDADPTFEKPLSRLTYLHTLPPREDFRAAYECLRRLVSIDAAARSDPMTSVALSLGKNAIGTEPSAEQLAELARTDVGRRLEAAVAAHWSPLGALAESSRLHWVGALVWLWDSGSQDFEATFRAKAIRTLLVVLEEELRERIVVPFREHVKRHPGLAEDLSQGCRALETAGGSEPTPLLAWLCHDTKLMLGPMFRMLRDGGARSDALHRAFADFCEDRAPGLLRLRKNEQEKLLAWRNDLAHHARSLSREEAESRYQTIKEAVGVVVGSNKRSTAGPDAD